TDANGCSATRSFTLTQPVAVTAPTSQASQLFCVGNTLANLVATVNSGETLEWYAASIGGIALVNTTTLVAGTTYYVQAVNSSGCVSSRTAVLTLSETTLPTVITQSVIVQLNASGTASVTAAQVNNGSTDNCSIATIVVNPSTFTSANVGVNTVTLTVTDVNGNVNTGTATVTVQDNILPTVITQNFTIALNASGTASITASQINNGSTDNSGIATIVVNPTNFSCANIGANTVTLTVTDVNGNVNTGTAIVTVQDNILPTVITQSVIVQLNASGTASVTAAQVNNGSTDNCSIATIVVNPSTFTSANVGVNTVTLTVTDVNGNVNTGTATVTVQDNILPTVITQNFTIALNASGTASITASQINNGSTDNSGIATIVVNPTNFSCANIGANTVTLTVTDVNGNVNTGTAIVTVTDTTLPIVITQGITTYLDSNGQTTITAAQVNNGSTDNCSINTITVSPTSFTCANVGPNTVTLTVTDVNGNVATATAIVTVAFDFTTTGDNDFDSLPDNCDIDDDNDGVRDVVDNCPLISNMTQIDTDMDGMGNDCDGDDDNDGVIDEDDNCPLTYNPNQEDRDNDGLGDVCDTIEINISQVITPNGDGINDTWMIYNIENHPNNVVKVYNRWGDEVFYAKNYQNNWAGTYKTKNVPDASSYYYQIDLDGDGSIDKDGWIYISK
ncbi:MAG: gliding motility-associated C-terminal domain-containing protein, partial [Flavobacterium sp.]